jgi:hypothetical protein
VITIASLYSFTNCLKEFYIIIRQYIPPYIQHNEKKTSLEVEEPIRSIEEMLAPNDVFIRSVNKPSIPQKKVVDFETPRYVRLPLITKKREGEDLSRKVGLFLPPNTKHRWSWSNPDGTGCKKKMVQVALIPISSNLEGNFVLYWSSAIKINVNGDTSVLLPYLTYGELKYKFYCVYFRSEDQIGLKVKSISVTAELLQIKPYQIKTHQDEGNKDEGNKNKGNKDEGNKDEPHEDSLIHPSPFTPKPPYILRNDTNYKCVFKQQSDKVRSNILVVPQKCEVYFTLFTHDLPPTLQIEIIKNKTYSIGFAEISLDIQPHDFQKNQQHCITFDKNV